MIHEECHHRGGKIGSKDLVIENIAGTAKVKDMSMSSVLREWAIQTGTKEGEPRRKDHQYWKHISCMMKNQKNQAWIVLLIAIVEVNKTKSKLTKDSYQAYVKKW
ncbi:unnamed protein product [Cuscuta campestris]|uniref:PARP-type domain-containing protein n=1 Tax=Cuscuta campestris TaxID=132261 RepID=A0A484KJU6_9ASTE|nr:unnamed protein product [Cuscuta campestris]